MHEAHQAFSESTEIKFLLDYLMIYHMNLAEVATRILESCLQKSSFQIDLYLLKYHFHQFILHLILQPKTLFKDLFLVNLIGDNK